MNSIDLLVLIGSTIIATGGVVLWWFVRRDRSGISEAIARSERSAGDRHAAIKAKVDQVERDLHTLRDLLLREFMPRQEVSGIRDEMREGMRGMREELLTWFRRLEDKLDRKADR